MTKLCQSCTDRAFGLSWNSSESAFNTVPVCRNKDLLQKLGFKYDDVVKINGEITECEFYKVRGNA